MLNLLKNINKNKLKSKRNNENLGLTPVKKGDDLFLIRNFPSSTKSWFNSIYSYDKNIMKSMPFFDLFVNNLIKMYFNLMSRVNLNKKFRRRRTKARRYSGNKVFVSKTEMKHSNNKVIITIYTYNRAKKYFFNNLFNLYKNIFINMPKTLRPSKRIYGYKNEFRSFWLKSIRNFFKGGIITRFLKEDLKYNKDYKNLRKLRFIKYMKYLYINNILRNRLNFILFKKFKSVSLRAPKVFRNYLLQSNILFKLLEEKKLFHVIKYLKKGDISFFKLNDFNNLKEYTNEYHNTFIKETLKKEMLYLKYNQLSKINEYKFNNLYLSYLSKIISTIYNKKIEFNIINLKYVHLDSRIFSESIVMKLRNRKSNLLRILRKALSLPKITKLKRYRFNAQNIYKNKYNYLSLNNIYSKMNYKEDLLHSILNKIFNLDNTSGSLKGKKSKIISLKSPISIAKEKFVYRSIKLRKIRGVRLEAKGRLTRRLTASRAIFKLRYKGSLKNFDNINKLSSVILRGSLRSNLDYVNMNSKTRNGSFGLKGWISSQ